MQLSPWLCTVVFPTKPKKTTCNNLSTLLRWACAAKYTGDRTEISRQRGQQKTPCMPEYAPHQTASTVRCHPNTSSRKIRRAWQLEKEKYTKALLTISPGVQTVSILNTNPSWYVHACLVSPVQLYQVSTPGVISKQHEEEPRPTYHLCNYRTNHERERRCFKRLLQQHP